MLWSYFCNEASICFCLSSSSFSASMRFLLYSSRTFSVLGSFSSSLGSLLPVSFSNVCWVVSFSGLSPAPLALSPRFSAASFPSFIAPRMLSSVVCVLLSVLSCTSPPSPRVPRMPFAPDKSTLPAPSSALPKFSALFVASSALNLMLFHASPMSLMSPSAASKDIVATSRRAVAACLPLAPAP